jgi:hypothetical protein
MADDADRIRDCEELEEFIFSKFPALRDREKEIQRILGGFLWVDKKLLEGSFDENDAAEAREKLRRAIRELENMDETTEAGRAWRRLTEARRAVCGGHASGAVISGAGPGYCNLVGLFAPGPAGSPSQPGKPDAARNGTAVKEAEELTPAEQKDQPDGPCDPYSFRWNGQTFPFGSDKRFWHFLNAVWPAFRGIRATKCDVINERLEARGRSGLEPNSMKTYVSFLNTFLGRIPGFPAKLEKDSEFIRWKDLPDKCL